MSGVARCDRCAKAMVQIELSVAGEPMTLRSCSRCDHRTWLVAGEPTELGGVLDQIAKTRKSA